MRLTSTPIGRRAFFAVLYFSEGAPIGYLWWAMPTRLADAGVPEERIGAITALLVLPWSLKILWAPLVDALQSRRWSLRGWILLPQSLMALTLAPLAFWQPGEALALMTALLVVHAVCAATQDVAIDALCIRTAPPEEHGRINGWMQVGMLAARGLFGGGALYLETKLGPGPVIGLMIGSIGLAAALVALNGPAPLPEGTRDHPFRAVNRAILRLITSRRAIAALLFAATGAVAFEGVGGFAGPILRDHGVSTEHVGAFFLAPVILLTCLGAVAGGRLSDRFGRTRVLGAVGAAVAACVMCLAFVFPGVETGLRLAQFGSLGLLYLLIGAFTASSYALFMDLTDPSIGATQFSACMGATNLCEAWAVLVAGALLARLGPPGAMLALGAMGLAPLALLPFLRPPRTGGG